jgi:hypothetical protein
MSSKQQAIAELAYLLWESRGRPENTAERDWAEAEALVAATDLTSRERPPSAESATRRKTDRKPKVAARRDVKRPAEKGSNSAE